MRLTFVQMSILRKFWSGVRDTIARKSPSFPLSALHVFTFRRVITELLSKNVPRSTQVWNVGANLPRNKGRVWCSAIHRNKLCCFQTRKSLQMTLLRCLAHFFHPSTCPKLQKKMCHFFIRLYSHLVRCNCYAQWELTYCPCCIQWRKCTKTTKHRISHVCAHSSGIRMLKYMCSA